MRRCEMFVIGLALVVGMGSGVAVYGGDIPVGYRWDLDGALDGPIGGDPAGWVDPDCGMVLASDGFGGGMYTSDVNPGAMSRLGVGAGYGGVRVQWIDPDGSSGGDPYEVYCDMTTDGGGWTLVRINMSTDGGGWTLLWIDPDGEGGVDPFQAGVGKAFDPAGGSFYIWSWLSSSVAGGVWDTVEYAITADKAGLVPLASDSYLLGAGELNVSGGFHAVGLGTTVVCGDAGFADMSVGVPEPATVLLLLGGLGVFRRRG